MIVAMSRRAQAGRTPARPPEPGIAEDGRPSKTQRKRDSQALQTLGEDLAGLSPQRLDALEMPPSLREAIAVLHQTRSHEGRRRQQQYIGKLMRGVDPLPLREAVAQARLGGAIDAMQLHEAERWRAELLADDGALTRWVERHPHTDLRRLRSLLDQARAHRRDAQAPGLPQRQERSHRELFRFVRDALRGAA